MLQWFIINVLASYIYYILHGQHFPKAYSVSLAFFKGISKGEFSLWRERIFIVCINVLSGIKVLWLCSEFGFFCNKKWVAKSIAWMKKMIVNRSTVLCKTGGKMAAVMWIHWGYYYLKTHNEVAQSLHSNLFPCSMFLFYFVHQAKHSKLI